MKTVEQRAADDKAILRALGRLKNGLSMPEIEEKTGLETRTARRALYRLRAQKLVVTEGEKRACRYFRKA